MEHNKNTFRKPRHGCQQNFYNLSACSQVPSDRVVPTSQKLEPISDQKVEMLGNRRDIMPGPNPAIIPGLQPTDDIPEREDIRPEEGPDLGDSDPDSKDGMPNDADVPSPVPNAI